LAAELGSSQSSYTAAVIDRSRVLNQRAYIYIDRKSAVDVHCFCWGDLQKADITLATANKLISKQIEIFSARKETGSDYLSEANSAISAGSFKGVAISSNSSRQPLINRAQFHQSLVDSMTGRMQPDAQKQLSQATQAFDHSLFPSELSPEFGESDVKFVCAKLGLLFSDVKFAFRDFKDSRGCRISNERLKLKSVVNTIPVSTAACERGLAK
jgi:hypothetical protein